MIKKTVLIQIEIPEGRCVTAHFMQIVYDDDGSELARSKPHTVTFMPDDDPTRMLAAINADITTREGMKWNPISADEWSRAVAHCDVEHTPEVKAAYSTFKAVQVQDIKE